MEGLIQLAEYWAKSDINLDNSVGDKDLLRFEDKYKVKIPEDLAAFFKLLNGTGGEYDENFFSVTSLASFCPIIVKYADWKGVPDYSSFLNESSKWENLFFLGDYQFSLISYGIMLPSTRSDSCDIYAISGSTHKVISKSFSGFVSMLLNDSDELYL